MKVIYPLLGKQVNIEGWVDKKVIGLINKLEEEFKMDMQRGKIKSFSGNANKQLQRIFVRIDVPLGCCEVGRFSDGKFL